VLFFFGKYSFAEAFDTVIAINVSNFVISNVRFGFFVHIFFKVIQTNQLQWVKEGSECKGQEQHA